MVLQVDTMHRGQEEDMVAQEDLVDTILGVVDMVDMTSQMDTQVVMEDQTEDNNMMGDLDLNL